MSGAIANLILPTTKLSGLSAETLLLIASRALHEVTTRTGSDEEYIVRTMAYKATKSALSCSRGEVYPNDELVKDLKSVRQFALSTIKAVS